MDGLDEKIKRTQRLRLEMIVAQVKAHGAGDYPYITAGLMGELDALVELQMLEKLRAKRDEVVIPQTEVIAMSLTLEERSIDIVSKLNPDGRDPDRDVAIDFVLQQLLQVEREARLSEVESTPRLGFLLGISEREAIYRYNKWRDKRLASLQPKAKEKA